MEKPISIQPQSVLVIDSDETILALISKHFRSLGVERVYSSSDGADAWEIFEAKSPDLVIMDWAVQSLNGAAIFNRIRGKIDGALKPIMVISGKLQKQDFRLLEEAFSTGFSPKPFTRSVFEREYGKVWAESRWNYSQASKISALFAMIERDVGMVVMRIKEIASKSPRPDTVLLMAAKKLRENGFAAEAGQLLEQVLKNSPDSIAVMNELGKCYHLLNRHSQALSILQKAQEYSSLNCNRLCLIGEVSLNMKDTGSARKAFQQALDIDPFCSEARHGIVLAQNIEEFTVQNYGSSTSIPQNFASLLNTIGIAKVRSGDLQGGIEQYRAAMVYLQDPDLLARVAFNLGLAYIRGSEYDRAFKWMLESYHLSDFKMLKAKKYLVILSQKVSQTEGSMPNLIKSISGPAKDSGKANTAALNVVADEFGIDSKEILDLDHEDFQIEDLEI
jgi:CheY-like chemotaxis protein